MNYTIDEIQSFIYCLHSLLVLKEGYSVENNTVVYKGIYFQIPNDWKVGKYFILENLFLLQKIKKLLNVIVMELD